jgi:ComF family protein
MLGRSFSTGNTATRPAWQAQWGRLWTALLNLIFPLRCAGCGQIGAAWCPVCNAQVQVIGADVCPHCGRPQPNRFPCPQCRRSPIEIDGIRSAVIFEGPVRQAIHHLKYNGKIGLAEPLGSFLAERWRREPLPADMIVPVPLHQARLQERGYNQSMLLAEQLARASGLPVAEAALKRVKATMPQVTLNAVERKENVQDAFEARAELVQDKRILLVDDVCTTGATLEACSLALKQGGAKSVWALTLGRAP